jgi:hypothetical protein
MVREGLSRDDESETVAYGTGNSSYTVGNGEG